MSALAWFTPYLFTAMVVVGISLGGALTWTGIFILFLLHPFLDWIIGKQKEDILHNQNIDILLFLYVPVQALFLIWAAWAASNAPTWWEFAGIVFSTGFLTGGLGITSAHELVHRTKRAQRALGVFLLTQVNYAHFRVEHVWGHHRWVATDRDPASAKKDDNIYFFIFKSFIGSWLSAWKIEKQNSRGSSPLRAILVNRMVHYQLVTVVFGLTCYLLGGWKLLLFWLAQSFVACSLLEIINYIEHYGLRRKQDANGKYEAVGPQHSWDCAYSLTNNTLFNLGKHAHHHWKAGIPYYHLKLNPEAPKMPMGYSQALVLALIPPLWKKTMNPMIPANQ